MLLIIAIIAMMLALLAYTTSVFSERKARMLNRKHVIIFWIGIQMATRAIFAH